MKNFNDIMSKKTTEIKAIIGELPNEFDSHYFIQKFAQKFQREYIEMLNLYIDNKKCKQIKELLKDSGVCQ